MHKARTDLCMWLGCLFLLILGAGAWSFDAFIARRGEPRKGDTT